MPMIPAGHKATSAAIVEQIAKRREVQHTREVVKQDVAPGTVQAIVRMADELDKARERIARLERVIGALAREVGEP